ncbi:MAG TPA: peptide-methionine (S)-S-oxide reductase MsrA [Oculatellaceae cyanobacterium]
MKYIEQLVMIPLLTITFTVGAYSFATTNEAKATDRLKVYTIVEDTKEHAKQLDVAYFAGGCFWGTQESLDEVPGVVSTLVGYCGGHTTSPSYKSVCKHDTGHAETVRVVYDPKKISYQKLARTFLDQHDPTTLNRQGFDIGDQYRSAIFYTDDQEKNEAQAAIAEKSKSLEPGRTVVTSLEKFKTFYTAEDYHQKYIARTGVASCHGH